MAPDYPPSLIVLDLRFVAERLMGKLQYVETATDRPLRVRLDADSCPQGFVSVGDGVAFVADGDDLFMPPVSPDAVPEDMGAGRYRRREQLRPNTTSAMLILILPLGYTVVNPSPPIATAREFRGRIAVCWSMRGDIHGHGAIEWSLTAIAQEIIPTSVQTLLRGSPTPDHQQPPSGTTGTTPDHTSTAATPLLDILSESDAPSQARAMGWFLRNMRKHPVITFAVAIGLVAFIARAQIATLFDREATYVNVTNFGVALEDTSIFVDLALQDRGTRGASISHVFLAAADSAALTKGWRGAVNLYANGPLQLRLPPTDQVTHRLYFYHAVVAKLSRHFPAGSRVHLSLNFVTLDEKGQQHWARSEIGALVLLDSSVDVGLLRPQNVVRFKLIPTGVAPPFPSAPPFEHGGASGPVHVVPMGPRDHGTATQESTGRH